MIAYRKDKILVSSTTANITSTGLTYTTSFAKMYRLVQVLIHLSAAVSPTITFTKDSHLGANYDTVLKTEVLSSATDLVWRPGNDDCIFISNDTGSDELKIVTTNVTASIFVTVEIEEL